MNALYKFGIAYPEDSPWTYPDVWATEPTSDGGSRLIIAPARNQIDLFLRLARAMPGPYGILYVLVVPRGGSQAGRYQCPQPLTLEELEVFLLEFKEFLEVDGRHHLWITSTSGPAILVYDKHNVIYGYGPAESWEFILANDGFSIARSVSFPLPHTHHYHSSMDVEEQRFLRHWDWIASSLRDSDDL